MERSAYPVDEKLFYLLVEEKFDELNTDELQRLFDNSSHDISDKWVFTSDKIKDFSFTSRLLGYKYFCLVDYGNDSTYEIGIPDVSESDDIEERQKCVIIDGGKTLNIISIKRAVFDTLANGTQTNNYLINNINQILINSFTDFFQDEFERIQDQAERNPSPTEQKRPFFVTYNVDLKQFQDHKNVVAEKLHILKDVADMNIREVFFELYTDKDDLIALINIELKTMDLVKAINEYIRADASLYLRWNDDVRYNRFDSQMLGQYREDKPDKENIKNVKQIISDELKDFSEDWYDNEVLILSSKNSFYFRSRQLIDKIYRFLRGFVSFIYNNILKLSFQKLYAFYSKIRSYVIEKTWIQVGISYTFLAIVTAFFQAPLSNYGKIIDWFQPLFSNFDKVKAWFQAFF